LLQSCIDNNDSTPLHQSDAGESGLAPSLLGPARA